MTFSKLRRLFARPLEILVRAFGRVQLYRMTNRERPRIEYWRSDGCWKATLHIHWNWKGGKWLLIPLPDFMP